jgi:hypothetical protein
MKIEKPIWFNNCEGYPDYVMTIPRMKECIEKIVDAVNEMQTKEETSRGPEPKALRDGDCFWDKFNKSPNILYTDENSSWRCTVIGTIQRDGPILFNILDLAAAVQRGEKVVALTKEECNVFLYSGIAYRDEDHWGKMYRKIHTAIRGGQ